MAEELDPVEAATLDSSKPRFLFCINPGRSGSRYLSGLFGSVAEVASFHEAPPPMTGDFLRLAERQPYPETYAARRHKADACRALLAAEPGKNVYAETNHMFIKTFFDVVVNELAPGASVGVVILRRELARTVKSFVELGIYTERNHAWPDWMGSVEATTRAVDPAVPEKTLTSIERTVAYLVDIEARAQRFRKDFPAVPVFETRLEAIGSDVEEVQRLFAWCGLTQNAATRSLIGKPANERTKRKAAVGASISYDACIEAVEEYLERCRKTGIKLPGTLARSPWQGEIASR